MSNNIKDKLFSAARDGDVHSLKSCLADPDCDVNALMDGEYEYTPLIQASWRGHIKCVQILLDAGADITFRDADGTALDNAYERKHFEIAAILEEAEGRKIDDPWQKLSDDEISNIEEYPPLQHKVTRIFNFRSMTMKEVTQNIETKAESSFILYFSDRAVGRHLIDLAQHEFENKGGIVDTAALRSSVDASGLRSIRRVTRSRP